MLGGTNSMSKGGEYSGALWLKLRVCVQEKEKMWERTGLF